MSGIWSRMGHGPDPGLAKGALRRLVDLTVGPTDICILQLQKMLLPSGRQFLVGVQGKQSSAGAAVLVRNALGLAVESIEDALGASG